MILHGHVLDKLQEVESESVQCVVTSPPYWGLRDYGTATWEGGDENCEHKVGRATRGGLTSFQVANKGSFGDEAIRQGERCPHCGAKRIDQQIGLEKTPEEFVENMVKVFREVKRVLKDDGTCWLNLGDSYASNGVYIKSWSERHPEKKHLHTENKERYGDDKKGFRGGEYNIKAKDLIGIPWSVAFALRNDGWYLRSDIIWHKPNPMPESVTDRCTKSHEYIFLLTKSAKYYYDNDAIKEQTTDSYEGRRGETKSRNKTQSAMGDRVFNIEYSPDMLRNKRSVWTVNTKPYKEAHFAVFPEKLPELCIKAGTKEGDTVLDPFFGSGTTGWVAQRLGRKWIGIELNAEYIKIAEKRFAQREMF